MELTGLLQMAPFRGMKEEELVAFLFGLPNSLKHFEPGDIIARQGDLCKGLYILASGSVRAGMINDEGKELTVEEIGAPNLLASAFIFATENRFPVNVEAIGPCEVFVIGKERFFEFMRLHPLMMQNVFLDISTNESLNSTKQTHSISCLKRHSCPKYPSKNSVIHNQQKVAQKLGVTRPSLARALSELVNEGKIKK